MDFNTGKEHQIAENLTTIIPVSWSPTENTILALAPDRRRISEKNYLGGIYKIDAKTGQETEVLSFSRDSFKDLSLVYNMAIEWSLDGKSIFYIKENIIKRNLETGNQETFYQAQNILKFLKRSPSDNKLVFLDGIKLMMANSDNGIVKEIYSLKNDLKITNIVWSPDGSFIYINSGTSLWRLPINGGEIQKIHQFKKGKVYVSFSPDGNKVAISEYEQKYDLRLMENLIKELEKIYSQNEKTND